ncbi:MAG: bifunctional folylpolyglutamate synthase/dihydrofolate synthase [Oscillospiraceae bacterium]|jgi:dihydrofolate synthase/folylpolyglutamate synthase|nr:bifunctional folylpolyglutamate synthase/dihydrofolate synthase [Oscillospiraceae bacterium]
MNYQQALEYINHTAQFGNKPGLERVAALLKAFGDPHKALKFVHIAGTNGKGSTCAMTESILRTAGYKVGLYISPYLEDYRERMQINREPIPAGTLAELITQAAAFCAQLADHPRKFEIETAVAMRYFADQGCDIVVLEVGLGGRLDATNVISAPEVAAIASIAQDHVQVLGSDLGLIAYEKCGILKNGCHAVSCSAQHPAAAEVIERRCAEEDVPLSIADETALYVTDMGLYGSKFAYKRMSYEISLIGAHQLQNALTAIEIIIALQKRGWAIPQIAVRDGLSAARWSGRLEIIKEKPLCLIDGAHNLDAVSMLCGAIDGLMDGKKLITIMAMSRDKRYDICAPMVARRSTHFIATEFTGMHPVPAAELAKASLRCAYPVPEPLVIPDVEEAVRKALELAGPDDAVLACGSLYMIGEAKRVMLT